ncbi:nuclear transport factor, putative [Entamoeba dispar SAW760]|uniref:Nuclear transport factor 2 n=1 Tax=Entamoeba dispar (strain ATCC PRA-260 / SAW760) TaxID=370354 RepID=B0E712_ENTDS|nr:nuclear transport factor, putative [Entamoeba dispar SAW760]EDR29753.1 nuclear transport factor, putative [Entamoeba dispar SAW760]|eukprot:EDR29753.1 nuclear transport factor, putative [Entamoeba dispar SAW760]
MSQEQLIQFANQFVNVFYNAFDTNKSNLANFFQQMSTLTFETNTVQGQQAVLEKIRSLPFTSTKHVISVIDAQQIPSNGVTMVLIKVIGKLSIDNENPHTFTETFVLAQNNGNWFVLNDIMRLADI